MVFIMRLLGKVILGKCAKGHNLDFMDIYLINDQEAIHSLALAISNYCDTDNSITKLEFGNP